MHSFAVALLAGPHVSLPEGVTPNLQLLLRWIHFIAGITWVGLLYFLNLVNTPFLKELDPSQRARVIPLLLPRALWWFRWSSVVTVLAGIWYWMMIVHADAHNAGAAGGHAIWTFFAVWTAAFGLEMGLLMAPIELFRRGLPFGAVTGMAVAFAAYVYLALNSHGWESNRLLAIGIGGGLGWFMMLNVWGIVWRAQKKIIRWMAESSAAGTPMPLEAARLSRLAGLAARTNFVLSFPMLLMMAVASHYPMLGR